MNGKIFYNTWYIKNDDSENGPYCSFDLDYWIIDNKIEFSNLISPNRINYFKYEQYIKLNKNILEIMFFHNLKIDQYIEQQEDRIKKLKNPKNLVINYELTKILKEIIGIN